jgi:hypothetical protein
MVTPAEYTVKITAGGQTVEKQFQVEEDPRLQISPSDREERLKTLLQISALQKRADKVRLGVTALRTQTTTLQETWKKPGAPKVPENVEKSVGALKEKVDALNKRVAFGGPRESGDDPTEYVPPSVTQRLLRLSGGLDGYTTAPTGPQLEELAVLTKQASDLEASWKRISAEDVPALSKMVSSAGLGYITAQ